MGCTSSKSVSKTTLEAPMGRTSPKAVSKTALEAPATLLQGNASQSKNSEGYIATMGCTSSEPVSKTTLEAPMGCTCQAVSKTALEAPATLLQGNAPQIKNERLSNPYQDMENTRLAEILRTQKIAVIKASYFRDCLKKNMPFGDRASIPAEYIMNGDEVIETWKTYGAAFLFIFSYAWLTAQHPDPDQFHLETIVVILKVASFYFKKFDHRGEIGKPRPNGYQGEIGVIIDYCSLWQWGPSAEDQRTAAQVKDFKEAIKEINAPYAHQEITAVKLRAVPKEVQRKYDDRGWTLFESILIDGKPPSLKLGWSEGQSLGHLNVLDVAYHIGAYRTAEGLSNQLEASIDDFVDEQEGGRPPMTPERFKLEMEKRKSMAQSKGVPLFTNGSDQPFILDKYRAAFSQQVRCQECMIFRKKMNWKLEHVECLAEVLVHCEQLRELEVSWCFLYDEGAEKLAMGLAHCRSLLSLRLDNNCIGDAGLQRLAEVLRDMGKLEFLSLQFLDVKDAGFEHLAEALRGMHNLKACHLSSEPDIGDATLEKLKAATEGRDVDIQDRCDSMPWSAVKWSGLPSIESRSRAPRVGEAGFSAQRAIYD